MGNWELGQSSRGDVPVKSLYKMMRPAEKGGIKSGFGMISLLRLAVGNQYKYLSNNTCFLSF